MGNLLCGLEGEGEEKLEGEEKRLEEEGKEGE